MLKVMFIDDEEMTLNMLEHFIDWQSYGFHVAGKALDAGEGLALYQKVHPDVMLVDIRMPGMDGIELVERIRNSDRLTRILILSAYSEFEYAQKALSLNVDGYLLKPLDEKKLIAAIAKIRTEIEEERRRSLKVEVLEDDLNKLTHEYSAIKLLNLVTNHTDEKLSAAEAEFAERLHFGGYAVAVLRGQARTEASFISRIERVVEAIPPLRCLTVEESAAEYVAVYYTGSSQLPDMSGLITELEKLVGEAEELNCGVSPAVAEVGMLYRQYQEASEACERCFYRKTATVLMYSEGPFFSDNVLNFKMTVDEMVLRIQAEGYGWLHQKAADMITGFERANIHPKLVKEACSDFLQSVFRSISGGILHGVAAGQELFDPDQLRRANRCSALREMIETSLDQYIQTVDTVLNRDRNNKVIIRAQEYARQRFCAPDFSVREVADHIGFSKSYFSKIYSEHTGESFWDYVIKLRIEKAKQLLRETNKTQYDIAFDIGYNSEYHFSRIFNKIVGITPSQYKRIFATE